MEILAEYVETLLSSLADPAFLLDSTGRVRHANPAARTAFPEIHDASSPEDLGRSLSWRRAEACVTQCLEQGRPFFHLLRGDGRRPVFEVTLTPLPRTVYGSSGALLVVNNVAGEAILEERRNALERVFDGIAEGVFLLDEGGRITSMNRSAGALLETEEAELKRRAVTEALRFDRPGDGTRLRKALEAGRSTRFDTVLRTARNRVLHCALSLSRLETGSAGGGAYALILTDRTERVRMEQRFLQVDRLNALGQFVAGFAHEINNPLATVIGFAQLLSARAPDEAFRDDLEVLLRHAMRCKEIVEKLLAFAREGEPERKELDLNETVRAVCGLLRRPLEREGIRFQVELDPALPPVYADETQVQQVLVNLVENGRYALVAEGEGGTLTIRTRRRGDRAVIRVEDDGPGIPEDAVQRIMEPFFTTKPPGKGTGLGLSLSHGIVEQHGGSLTAANRPEGGACFEVIFPLRNMS